MSVFITKGANVSIPKLAISVDEQGQFSLQMKLQVHADISPAWMQWAIKHVASAQVAATDLERLWPNANPEERTTALEREFEEAVQAIVCAGIAIDAFYASVRPRVKIDENLLRAWKNNRTPRHRQISEVFKLGFSIAGENAAKVAAILEEVFRYRNGAVHPINGPDYPVMHPRLNVGLEPRLVSYRFENALALVHNSISMIWQISHVPKARNKDLFNWCAGFSKRLEPVVAHFKGFFGEFR